MIGKFFLLGLVAFAQARPDEIVFISAKCPSGEVNYMIPNERDCSKFYYCGLGRTLKEGACEPGLEFSIELQQCADPAIAKCNCDTDPDPEPAPQPTPQPQPQPTIPENYDRLPNGCPESMHIPELLPHETQCHLYYHCDKGEKVLRPCAEGTYFVYELQTCDHSWKVDCVSTGEWDSSELPGGGGEPEEPKEEDTDFERLPNGCPADWHIHYLLPHAKCDRFYQCVHGNLVEMPCAPGTHFSYELQVCDHIWAVGCVDKEPETEECVCEDGEESCEDGGNSNENGGSSNENGGSSNENGGSSNENGGSSNENGGSSNENGGSSNENGGNSNENGGNSNENGGGSDENGGGSDENGGDSNENGGDSGENGCDCEPENDELRCKEDCHVPHWAHATDCDKFWRCVGEEKVLGICAEGLHFNPQTQTCDFMCNAGCVRSEIQTTAYQEGLKVFLPWNRINEVFSEETITKEALMKSHKLPIQA